PPPGRLCPGADGRRPLLPSRRLDPQARARPPPPARARRAAPPRSRPRASPRPGPLPVRRPMLATPTLDKLHALKLPALAQAWTEQQQNAELAGLGFDERLGLLVDAEWLARENTRLARALQEAKLKLPQACIEAIDDPARRELDKAVIRQLATCRWIDEHLQVLVTGATGTGKSFIACALAHQACRRGYRAYYRPASRLLADLRWARSAGTHGRLLGKLARMDVLLLDDWGLAPPQDQERRDLLELLEDRYESRHTIVTHQLRPTQRHDHIRNATPTDASRV